jgi:hypothetical protein
VARVDANISDPLTIKIEEFRPDDFESAAQAHLDLLWSKLLQNEQITEKRIKELIELKRQEEQSFIRDTPVTQEGEQDSLINRRIQHLHYLQHEYDFMFSELKEREAPRVPLRPTELEAKLTHQPNWAPCACLGLDVITPARSPSNTTTISIPMPERFATSNWYNFSKSYASRSSLPWSSR